MAAKKKSVPDWSFELAGKTFAPGERGAVDVELPGLYTQAETHMPVHVLCGKKPGPKLLVSAVIHGDELNGLEIVRRLLVSKSIRPLRGVLVAVPVVNVYGCLNRSRYLPDGRDLNRSFPGSAKGSMASRLAFQFMRDIVSQVDYGIDLHTAGGQRDNLPHLRSAPEMPETLEMAKAFGAPVVLHADLLDGSLRHAALEQGIPMLLFEGGAALSFDELAIRTGVRGIVRVMRHIGMLPGASKRRAVEPVVVRRSSWVRAPESGVFRAFKPLGSVVEAGEQLGAVSNLLGDQEIPVVASRGGVVIGTCRLPLVHEGEALFHVGQPDSGQTADETLDQFQDEHNLDKDLAGHPRVF
ncbi:MAG: succinylglutamate desuccinylase/aspartoacylase family protein [Lysobacterales bacterium]